ncbi:hypothetical protein [Emticicia sp.]|uniref:hypothetical protein n=1 Tax=Emticicia sp. TaxID=1930953 RepID=UPI0037515879
MEQLCGILRIGEREFERFFDFKRYILQQAQKEQAIYDSGFEFKEKKQGKRLLLYSFFQKKCFRKS